MKLKNNGCSQILNIVVTYPGSNSEMSYQIGEEIFQWTYIRSRYKYLGWVDVLCISIPIPITQPSFTIRIETCSLRN